MNMIGSQPTPRTSHLSLDEDSERLAVFESEGVSTEVICAYFGCDEERLERLRSPARHDV